MTTQLLLAPAATGKTQICLAQLHSLLDDNLLAPVWVLLPDRNQTIAFRRRLGETGGALGARVGTFGDLYTELLALADAPLPVAPEPVLHRVVKSAITTVADSGQLKYYAPIRQRPGLVSALADLFAELKRARITPDEFKEALIGSGSRLEELAELYYHYQSLLIKFDWADPEGLGWLAILQLQSRTALASDWHVLVDGFDSFTFTQLETLALLEARAGSLTITLTGESGMARIAHRRFKTTLDKLQSHLTLTSNLVSIPSTRPTPLQDLEAGLFVAGYPKHPASPRIQFIEAQTRALEAQEALRWIKSRAVHDGIPIAACAVIARDLAPYQPFLREAAREFGLPLYLAAGEPLITNPAIASILNLLELTVRIWTRRSLVDVVRTPYFDLRQFGFLVGDATRLEDVARFGQVIAGLDQWQEALEQLAAEAVDAEQAVVVEDDRQPPALPRGPAARRLWKALENLAQRLAPPKTATPKLFVQWLEDILESARFEECVRVQPETAARDEAALEVFRDILRALMLTDEIFGKERALLFEEFYTEARGAVSGAIYGSQTIERRNAIYAANLDMARGVSYRAVAVLGLSEGLFPAPVSEDPFLSDDERLAFQGLGLPLEPRLRSDQQSLFYEAVTRARDYLLLTRPYLADDGEAWEPSPYWNAALELFGSVPVRVRAEQRRTLAEVASVEEALESAMQLGRLPDSLSLLAGEWRRLGHASGVLAARLNPEPSGQYEGDLAELSEVLAQRFDPDHIWSASRLESYGLCGFQFFIGPALGLKPHDPPQAGFDSAQLGSILHAILERLYQSANPSDPDALIAVLPVVAQAVFAAAPRNFGFRPTPLWKTEQQELLAMLETTIRNLAAEANGFEPVAFERRFDSLTLETSAGPVRLHGVIDRVDHDEAGQLRVIDYKTGSSHLDKSALVQGRRLQLPLYAAAAEQALNLGHSVEGLYWSVRKGEAGSLTLAAFAHTDSDGQTFNGLSGAQELAAEHIGQSVGGIRAGAFAPRPPADGCPDYCPAKNFCWRYAQGW